MGRHPCSKKFHLQISEKSEFHLLYKGLNDLVFLGLNEDFFVILETAHYVCTGCFNTLPTLVLGCNYFSRY